LTVGGCRIREPSAHVNDCGFFHRHKDSQTQPQSSGTALVMPNRIHVVNIFAALVVTVSATAAIAGDADPTFGSRTDKPDGSSALTVGRRLPTPWETKVGADVSLAAPSGIAAADNLVRGGVAQDRSSGAVWGNLTMPGLRPLGFDKTSVEARVDAGKDEGKLGATLSRSVPINPELSVTLQNSYSVKQSLATTGATGVPMPPTAGMPNTGAVAPAPAWGVDETVRLNVDPSGTTFSAGAGASTVDTQWHNKLSMEQTLVGPLKLTTSIEDAGTTTPKKSITAGFKRTW
jgi:hypothetical protein